MEELLRNGRRIAGITTIKRKPRGAFDEGPETVEFVTDTPIAPTSSDTDILSTDAGSIAVNIFQVEYGTRAMAFVRPDAK